MRLTTSARLTASLAVTALAAGLLGAAAPAARADSDRTTDQRTDVREVDTDGTNQERKRRDRTRDVVWAKASYADDKIRLWVEVRELGTSKYVLGWHLKDPTTDWAVGYDHTDGTPELTLSILGGGDAPCANLRADRYPGKELVKVVLPASCIGHPEWVKFGASAGHQVGPNRFRVDDARRDNKYDVSGLRLGPRIHEG